MVSDGSGRRCSLDTLLSSSWSHAWSLRTGYQVAADEDHYWDSKAEVWNCGITRVKADIIKQTSSSYPAIEAEWQLDAV